ncbi:hypothetical protein ACJJTC_010488 [Scirpophaga incertulas]
MSKALPLWFSGTQENNEQTGEKLLNPPAMMTPKTKNQEANDEDLITLDDILLGASANPAEFNFDLPAFSGAKIEKNNLDILAENYASESSDITSNTSISSDGDFSPTSGSEYIPSDFEDHGTNSVEDDTHSGNSLFRLPSFVPNSELQPLSPSLLDSLESGLEHPPNSTSMLNEAVQQNEESTDAEDELLSMGRPSRGRKRKCPQSRAERKRALNRNEEHYDYKRRLISPKEFINYICSCKRKCHNIVPLQVRKEFYNKYYKYIIA